MSFGRLIAAFVLNAAATLAASSGEAQTTSIKVIGGLAGVSQFTQFEEPFWTKEIGPLTGGRLSAAVHPFDRSGLRGQDMLQLMKLGVVPFGTALLSVSAGDDPELNALDLPALNPDLRTLRANLTVYRPHLSEMLIDRYGVELLGVYAYPAQVLYCAKPFTGLSDLSGRRVRTSSVGQSELMAALGAKPLIVPFAEIVPAVSTGVVDCVITGTLSGYEVGLSKVTSHVHAMALSWGLTVFGANATAWASLPADLRETIRAGVAGLETRIWDAAERETARGLACNTGRSDCGAGLPGRMTLVAVSAEDEARRRKLLVETVLPSWLDRCGPTCAPAWNSTLGQALDLPVQAR